MVVDLVDYRRFKQLNSSFLFRGACIFFVEIFYGSFPSVGTPEICHEIIFHSAVSRQKNQVVINCVFEKEDNNKQYDSNCYNNRPFPLFLLFYNWAATLGAA